ncbi:uncharacterized protein LOC144102468 [Amblyomma americanum]
MTFPTLPSPTLPPPPVTSASSPATSTVHTTPTPSSSSSSTRRTPPTTTPSHTTPSTASQTTVSSSISFLNKAPTNSSLICTVACTKPISVPNDGLCDFMLFDSLYSSCGGEVAAHSLSRSLQAFVTLAAASRNTQYGCSVDALAVGDFVNGLRKTQAKAWVEENLLKNKVYHWGAMNVHKVYLEGSQGVLKAALEGLKDAVTFSRPLAHQRQIAPYTFLGCYGGCQTIGQELKSVFTPDAIVILGHMSFQPYAISSEIPNFRCIILPPNIYQIPAPVRSLAPYAHTYYEGCRLAECLRTQHKLQVPIGVSLTLKGRWWVPLTDDEKSAPSAIGSYGLYKECALRSFDQDALPGVVCNMTNANYTKNVQLDQDAQSLTAYDKGPGFKQTFAFDNHQTYRQKLCDAKYNLTQVVFTVAAYDVNYDSVTMSCQRTQVFGRYVRTVRLRRIGRFLNDNYTDSSKHASCLAL